MMASLLKFSNCHAEDARWSWRVDARHAQVSAWAIALMGVVVSSNPAAAQHPNLDSLPPGTAMPIHRVSEDQWFRGFLFDLPGFGRDSVRQIIRDRRTWESFWSTATVRGTQIAPEHRSPPTVDFHRDMVIVAGNSRSHSGADIAILGAVARADSLYVLVRSRTGVGPACHEESYSHPMALALVHKSNEPVIFVEMVRNEWCGHPPPP